MRQHRTFYAALLLIGLSWGAVMPISKIAVSTGYQPYGLMVWQMLIGIVMTGAITLIRGKKLVFTGRYLLFFLGVACLASVFPNYFFYTALANLPAGIVAILITLTPLFAMPIALAMGYEKASSLRFAGLAFGTVAVWLMVGPEASLPDPGKIGFVLLVLLVPLAYGAEGNYLHWIGNKGLDPFQIMFGASIIGLAISLPLALGTGVYINPVKPWGAAEFAVVTASVLNQLTYAGYIWLVGRAGPVFASQVTYIVTLSGVLASMLVLGERYSGYIWAALALMLVGLFLVQPREE